MANPRLNTRQKKWLESFISKYPYYKLRSIRDGLSGDRIVLLEGTERLPLPLIREFVGASPGYRLHTLEIKIRIYGDPRLSATHTVETIYPHCNIGGKITCNQTEGQLSLSLATALEIPRQSTQLLSTGSSKVKPEPNLVLS